VHTGVPNKDITYLLDKLFASKVDEDESDNTIQIRTRYIVAKALYKET
jgi:hypothetical protein